MIFISSFMAVPFLMMIEWNLDSNGMGTAAQSRVAA